jgi:SPP1 family phage portal protein
MSDKVNEFEQGEDAPVAEVKTFQQTYKPDANFSYRVNNADEILSDTKKLEALIQDHYMNQCPRLEALDNYIKARNEDIYHDDSRRVEKGKADHRAAHNFAKVINVFDVGYNTGIPIKKKSQDDKITEIITEYDKNNDIEGLESELWRDVSKYGRAYELQYRDEDDIDHSVISNVFETFVVYSTDVDRHPLFAVSCPRYKIGAIENTVVTVYTDTDIITYQPCSINMINLVEDHREPHSWGEVPITEYQSDRYRQGAYEDVISLIDLYDAAQSDTANYMTDLNEATMVISGDIDLAKYSVKDFIDMKKSNMLLLANGVNPDGSKSQTSADYIYKQYDVNGTEAYKERLANDIHKISFVPDLTDSAFSGNQTGEAMKYKLFGFQQYSATRQRSFKKGIIRRYRLLLNIKNSVQEADNTDLDNLTITFTPNLPKAVLEELSALTSAGTEISQETLLSLASFVDDVQAELDRLKKEQQENMDRLNGDGYEFDHDDDNEDGDVSGEEDE